MPYFNQSFLVEGATLDFRFSLIHYPGGSRYWVVAMREERYVTSFYLQPGANGAWKLADRYKTAPAWVHALEPLLSEAITGHFSAPAEQPFRC